MMGEKTQWTTTGALGEKAAMGVNWLGFYQSSGRF